MVRNNELKRIRLEHKTSQSLLATIAGVSARSISRYENGTQMPNVEAALRIASYYNMIRMQMVYVVILKQLDRVKAVAAYTTAFGKD